MKKIIALVLAVLMIAAMSIPAFADRAFSETEQTVADTNVDEVVDGTADPDASAETKDFLVEYGVDQTYTVTIPADVFFTGSADTEGDFKDYFKQERTVSAADVKIAGNEKLTVTVASATNFWKMVDTNGASTAVDYFCTKDTVANKFAQDEAEHEVLSVAAPVGNNGTTGNSGSQAVTFFTKGTAQEGNYKDVLTFAVDVVLVQ